MLLSTGRFFAAGGGGGGGGSWSPADLGAALLAWYKGDELAGSNGDPISTWPDDSGGGHDATQGTSDKRPTLAAADLNGKNAVRFTSSSQQALNLPNIFSGASAGSAYLIVKAAADPAASNASSGLMWMGSVVSTQSATHWPYTSGTAYDAFGSTDRKTLGNPTPSLASWRIAGFHSAAGDYGVRLDGNAFFSTGTNTVGWSSAPRIGQSAHSSSPIYFNGWIAEAIFTTAKQSDADRQKVEGYLAHKWGLTGNLDAGHPYKSAPP